MNQHDVLKAKIKTVVQRLMPWELDKIVEAVMEAEKIAPGYLIQIHDAMDKMSNGISNEDWNWLGSGFSDLEETIGLIENQQ